jgi:uroporphyrinogen-III decarboxylase
MMPLHRGSDGFMSIEQFETFYWPQLKGLMLDMIDAGLIPAPFYEGIWDNRLHYLAELPKGKTRGSFEKTNMFKAKEIIGDRICITGGFPVSLLQTGPAEKVREHTKKMCEEVGKNGGFIMAAGSAMDYCDKELVKIWVESTKEYGKY